MLYSSARPDGHSLLCSTTGQGGCSDLPAIAAPPDRGDCWPKLVTFMELKVANALRRGRRVTAGAVGLFGLVAILGGCAHFTAKPLAPARNADAFDRRSLTEAGLRAFLETNGVVSAWPRASWDAQALTLVAFYYHPDLE